MDTLLDFLRFLNRSPTVFHAAKEISNRLAEADFTPLQEDEKWVLEPGKGYFLIRGDSLVAAFRIPKKEPKSATILASHIDSPCLKLKPFPEQESSEMVRLNTEVYGAPLLHTWLDRDLFISGRVTGMNQSTLHSQIVSLDESPVIIPSLAIHLDRTVTEKGLLVHKQDHLKPIFSLTLKGGEKQLEERLCVAANIDKLLSFDLFLTPVEIPHFVGFNNEMIAAYRLDNLTTAYAALFGMLQSVPRSDTLQIALFWDHEEIGSTSYVGADSLFANQILERICLSFKMDREDYYRLKSRSHCISGDLTHGFNPNFTDKYDPQNSPYLGKGPVIKFNANQKYATSSTSAAAVLRVAEKHKIPMQKFANRSDIPSGSTVGSIMAANLGVSTVDVGIAGWGMHSIRETVASKDELSLCELFKALLDEKLLSEANSWNT